ncbi:hypothetical protein Pint_22544 [Pistacia integerrima]|uniref:Uncharacterized protein n=1 Tax=Pistacia integerrima TaxID=434235 RepID=A0ACC0YHF8_9ROSI|nr:hypothetical protein Pint_22544 [Pistacia integerrima]
MEGHPSAFPRCTGVLEMKEGRSSCNRLWSNVFRRCHRLIAFILAKGERIMTLKSYFDRHWYIFPMRRELWPLIDFWAMTMSRARRRMGDSEASTGRVAYESELLVPEGEERTLLRAMGEFLDHIRAPLGILLNRIPGSKEELVRMEEVVVSARADCKRELDAMRHTLCYKNRHIKANMKELGKLNTKNERLAQLVAAHQDASPKILPLLVKISICPDV